MSIVQMTLIVLYAGVLLSLSLWGLKKKIALSFVTILIIGVCIRILLSFSFIDLIHYDTLSYQLIGRLTLAGKSMYPVYAYAHYPYFPGLNYIEALAIFLNQFGFPSMLFLKLFFCLFDVGNIVLLYLLSKKNLQVAFLYAVNPAMIFLSAVHGQIEAIPIFFSLLAIYLFKHQKQLLVSIALGLAILAKVWPVLFLPFFLKYTKKWQLYIISLAIPIVSILLYSQLFHASLIQMLYPPLSYRGGYGAWGISTVFHFLLPADQGLNDKIYKMITNITILFLFIFALRRKRTNLLHELFVFMLLFGVVVVSGANPLWLVPFMFLLQPKKWTYWLMGINIYSSVTIIAEIAYMYHRPWNATFLILEQVLAFILWLITIQITYNYFQVNLRPLKQRLFPFVQ